VTEILDIAGAGQTRRESACQAMSDVWKIKMRCCHSVDLADQGKKDEIQSRASVGAAP